jgi:hypothetical protein
MDTPKSNVTTTCQPKNHKKHRTEGESLRNSQIDVVEKNFFPIPQFSGVKIAIAATENNFFCMNNITRLMGLVKRIRLRGLLFCVGPPLAKVPLMHARGNLCRLVLFGIYSAK